MKERALIDAIHRRLPSILHRQGMTGASYTSNGTPDYYYDPHERELLCDNLRDLWIEYKSLKSMPRSKIVIGDFSPLQLAWLDRRWRNGRNAWGIVGLPNRTAVIQKGPVQWKEGTGIETALSFDEVARCIYAFCGFSSDLPRK